MKTKLINGLIYDGNGGRPFPGEIAFEDDTIQAVGTKLDGDFDNVLTWAAKLYAPALLIRTAIPISEFLWTPPFHPKYGRE